MAIGKPRIKQYAATNANGRLGLIITIRDITNVNYRAIAIAHVAILGLAMFAVNLRRQKHDYIKNVQGSRD